MFPFLHDTRAQLPDPEQAAGELGQKGAYLRWAAGLSERVPPGFVVPCAHAAGLTDRDAGAVSDLRSALERLCAQLGPDARLAVRSSPSYSLPGALLSVLDLPVGSDADARLDAVLAAVDRVLESARKKPALDQRAAMSMRPSSGAEVAVVVQVMINVASNQDFGAVAFSHDPATGAPGLLGELALGQPAAAVVSGRRRPQPLALRNARPGQEAECLEGRAPDVYAQVVALTQRLSDAADQPLELELVFAHGELWVVQARPLVLSPRGKLAVLLSALENGRPSVQRLVAELPVKDLARLIELRVSDRTLLSATVVARGLAASPGVVTGRLVFDLEEATRRGPHESIVLVRRDALPEDVAAFRAAKAVITTSGGLTSHASVIARGLRIAAVIGCSDLRLDARAGCLRQVSTDPEAPPVAQANDLVTVDGHRGLVFAGEISALPVVPPELAQVCVRLKGHRVRQLFALGPSVASDYAYEQCSLDGVWDAQRHTHVRGSAADGAVTIHDDLPTDSAFHGQSPSEAVACRPEHAAAWALFLAREHK